MRIHKLRLLTKELDQLRGFYTNVLGFSLLDDFNDSFTVKVGQSYLTFEQTLNRGERPFYHFAFDIPGNKIDESIAWLYSRGVSVNLLPENSHKIYSISWNATSIYFYDPSENIVEFIARHTLENETPTPFSTAQLLNISEIGLVVNDVPKTMELLKMNILIDSYKDNNETFAPIGDEDGLFILSAKNRVWLGSNKRANIFKTEVTVSGVHTGVFSIGAYPYIIMIS